jgi:protease-4
VLASAALAGALLAPDAWAQSALRPTVTVPDPGKGLASADDSSAIVVNPANLAWLPAPELRWTFAWTGDDVSRPIRGSAWSLAAPLWLFASGLRFDLMAPSVAAPAPFGPSVHGFARWSLAVRSGDAFAFGTTFGWSVSDDPDLNGLFSVTSGVTVRPASYVSLAAVARDWNRGGNAAGTVTSRAFDLGFALRPLGSRVLEVGAEVAYVQDSNDWVPRAVLGVDVPRVGRLRGDLSVYDPTSGDAKVLAMAGLDVNFDVLQVSAGALFGDALVRQGAAGGFYVGAAMRGYREPGVPKAARVVRLKLTGTPGVRGHTRLLRRLWKLADDPEVEGVVLVMQGAEPASSLAHAEEVGDAFRLLRAKGKKVMCHLEDAGGRSLYACSQADRVVMNPAGGFRFAGLSSSYFYYGGLLKKLGVKADFVRIGAHKLAAESYALPASTEVGKVDHQELVDELERTFLHDVGGGRKIPLTELKRRIAKGPFVAREARDAGLVDSLAFEDELGRAVDEMMGRRSKVVDLATPPKAPDRWRGQPYVCMVYLHGDMVDGESQYIPLIGIRLAGSRTIARALKACRDDGDAKAVLFRIETGGGSSLAADVIVREAILTAKAKPMVVSMGTAAASGGYYAAMAGKTLFANRATITGSIGIFYGKVDLSGLLGKLGVRVESFRSAPRADAESLYRAFTDAERRELGVKVKQFYDAFIGRVVEGRKLTAAEVDAVARGKVWTGEQALVRKLVDRVGGLRQALAEARRLGGLPDDSPIAELPGDDETILGFLLKELGIRLSASGGPPFPLPPALVDVARAFAPFWVFDGQRPLARVELGELGDAGVDDLEHQAKSP